jgi:asparagine synthase (glutamine-hydrolysing)
MCGICGCVQNENAKAIVEKMLNALQHRGIETKDSKPINTTNTTYFGHNLLALVDFVPQPLQEKNCTLVFNGEIYNWKQLATTHNVNVKNDAELVFKLLLNNANKLTSEINNIIEQFDGVFAFAFSNEKEIILARDKIGVKPLWFSKTPFMFASEKKALLEIECQDIHELNPRTIILYNIEQNTFNSIEQPFFSLKPNTDSKEQIYKKTKQLLIDAVLKRIPDPTKKVGILFSGGIDSTVIAKILQDAHIPFTCYSAGFIDTETKYPEDIEIAKKVAKDLNLPLKINLLNKQDVLERLTKIIPIIEEADVVKAGVALPFFASCELAKEDNVQIIFSGLGSEEIFAGYQRHKTSQVEINEECLLGLYEMHKRDLYRDDVITMSHTIELRLPFLDKQLVSYALTIPSTYKIVNDVEKAILRDISKELNVPEYVCQRKKRAAQYGSRFDQALKKLAKNQHFKYKVDFLEQFL